MFSDYKILLKSFIETMGNTPQVLTNHAASLQSSSRSRNHDMRLIGPSHLPFTKMSPKTIDINEDLITAFDEDMVTREIKEG